MPSKPKSYLRAPEAARYAGHAPSTFAKMRLRGDGPPYFKAGARLVLYSPDDIDEWLAARRRFSTSDVRRRGNES